MPDFSFFPLPTNLLPYWFFPWNTDTWSGYTPFIFHKELLAIDALRQIFVWKEFAFSQLLQGRLPLWNPYNFSGQPLLANFQSSVFYPLSWMFLLPDLKFAWSLYIFIQPILAGLFMFLFLRKGLFLSRVAAIFGLVSLIFCSFLASRYFWGVCVHTLLWLPLVLLWIELYAKKKISPTLFIALAASTVAVSILGGYPQFAAFVLVISIAYYIFRNRFKKISLILISIALAILICAVQLLPTFELYKNSLRDTQTSSDVFSDSMIDPHHLITIFSPDYYGSPASGNYFGGKDYSGVNAYFGIIPLVFALYALKNWKDKNVRFWTIIGSLGLLFALKNPIAFLPEILNIPVFNSGGPWSNLFFFQFSGIILSAIGINEFSRSKEGLYKPIFLVLLFLLALAFIGRQSTISVRNTTLIIFYLSGLLVCLMFIKKYLPIVAILLLIISGSIYLLKISPFGEIRYFYPEHPIITYIQNNAGINRYDGFSDSQLAANIATHYKIYDPKGYDSLYPRWYGELIAAAGNSGVIPRKINRADVFFLDKYSEEKRRLQNLLGIKYFWEKSSLPQGDIKPKIVKYSIERFDRVAVWGQVSVYKNKESFPRAFLGDSYVVAKGISAVKKVFDPKIDLRKTIILGTPT